MVLHFGVQLDGPNVPLHASMSSLAIGLFLILLVEQDHIVVSFDGKLFLLDSIASTSVPSTPTAIVFSEPLLITP